MSLAAGARLGPYEILSPIGAGGMGEVYKARDSRLARTVAIKVLPESFAADGDRLRRFEIEAKAAGALNHPNILVVHDIGSDSGTPYLVSELLEGESLRERLQRGKLSPARALEFARQVVAGLAAAHAKGIVHRDLKPDNIFITRDGRAKILDFGLAKVVAASAGAAEGATRTLATDPGTVVGTMSYMSPEQVRAQAVDHRSDIFSFGCVLYEMVTGTRAFQGQSAADTMSAILNADPVETLPPDGALPPALARTIRHCLEKDIDERFQSAKDLAFDLEFSTSASGLSPAVPAGPSPARKRIPLWAPVLCAALAGAALTWLLARPKISSPVYEGLTFLRGIIHQARFGADGQTIVYSAAWSGQPLQIYSTQQGQPESRAVGEAGTALYSISRSGEVAGATGARFQGAFQTEGTLARMPLNGGAPREVLETVRSADWTPDGAQLAAVIGVGSNNARLEFPLGHVLYQSSGTGWPGDIRFSPKGDLIAFADHYYYGDDGSFAVIDLKGNKRNLSSQFTSLQGLAWTPDGSEIWFTGSHKGGQRSLYAVTLSGKERTVQPLAGLWTLRDIAKDGRALLSRDDSRIELELMSPASDRARDLSWLDWSTVDDLSADGTLMMFTESGDGVAGHHVTYVRKTDGSPPVKMTDNGDGLVLSPDARWLLSEDELNTKSQELMLLPLRAGVATRFDVGDLHLSRPQWFADSKRLAFTGTKDGKSRIYVQSLNGKPQAASPEGVNLIGLSPDDTQFLARDSNGYALYPVGSGSAVRVQGMSTDIAYWRFAGSSKAVYISPVKDRNRIERLDLETGKRELWRELHPTDPSGVRGLGIVRVSADGRTIAYNVYRTESVLYLVTGLK